MRLHDRNDSHSVKSSRSILYSELKAHVLAPSEGNNKGDQTNILHYILEMYFKVQVDFGELLKMAKPFGNTFFSTANCAVA